MRRGGALALQGRHRALVPSARARAGWEPFHLPRSARRPTASSQPPPPISTDSTHGLPASPESSARARRPGVPLRMPPMRPVRSSADPADQPIRYVQPSLLSSTTCRSASQRRIAASARAISRRSTIRVLTNTVSMTILRPDATPVGDTNRVRSQIETQLPELPVQLPRIGLPEQWPVVLQQIDVERGMSEHVRRKLLEPFTHLWFQFNATPTHSVDAITANKDPYAHRITRRERPCRPGAKRMTRQRATLDCYPSQRAVLTTQRASGWSPAALRAASSPAGRRAHYPPSRTSRG